MFFSDTLQSSNNFFTNLGLIGVGVIIATIAGAVGNYKTKKLELTMAKESWLRDKRLVAFSNFSKAILSFHTLTNDNTLKLLSEADELAFLATETILLVDDTSLKNKLFQYIDDYRDLMDGLKEMKKKLNGQEVNKNTKQYKDAEKLLDKLDKESRQIVDLLAKHLA